MATIPGLTEDFAGGAPGATITTANTIFNSIDTSLGAVPGTFNDDAYTGTLQSMNVSTSAETSSHRVDHDPAGGWRGIGIRLLTVDPAANALMNWFSGTTKGGDLRVLPDRTLQLRNVSAGVYTSPVLALATWYYVTVKMNPNSATGHRLKIYQGGTLLADSGDLNASAVVASYDNLRVGSISSSTQQIRFARLRGDTTTEPSTGITPSTAEVIYVRSAESVERIDTTGSTGTMTLTQDSGPTATIAGPTSGVFTATIPTASFTSAAVFTLTATAGAVTDNETITVQPPSGGSLIRVFDGTDWVSDPTGGATPPPVGAYDGWDPASNTPPAERATRSYHNNTGLYLQSDVDALTVVPGPSDFTTTTVGQVIEGQDFVEDVVVAHSGVTFKRCRFRKGIDTGPLVSADTAPVFIYCDAIYNLGGATTSIKNLISGPGKFYRCNISGYVDAVAIKTAADNSGQRSLLQDCFVHDFRLVDDPGQPGRSHNDIGFQSNQSGAACDAFNTTFFGSATNNFSASESWTRSSGPHWTAGATVYACTFENPSTGGDAVGRVNAVVQMQAGSGSEFNMRRCLVAGSMFRVTNATTGNVCHLVDNEIATEHMDSGNRWDGGTIATKTGNRNWLTGATV